MPSTPEPSSTLASRSLVLATLRSHRAAILAWVIGGTLVMLGMSYAIATEMADFPGGPQALAASIMPGAEAMRPMRWPAERLDTLGGYVTYHNLMVFSFFLSLYAGIQGTRAIRRSEERAVMEEILATGVTRAAAVRDTSIAFAVMLVLTCTAVAVGVAAAMALGGEPDVAGSFISLASVGLCAMTCYGIGLVISQFTRTSRSGAGVTGLVLVSLYLASTTLDPPGGVGFLAWLSPFWWANRSRALVPGQGLDPVAFLVMAATAVGLIALAAVLFGRRDYQAPVWRLPVRHRAARAWRPGRIARLALGSVWSATLLRSRVGLAAWVASAAAFAALMVSLSPAVMDVWENFSFLTEMFASRGVTLAEQYMSFSAEFAWGPQLGWWFLPSLSGFPCRGRGWAGRWWSRWCSVWRSPVSQPCWWPG